MVELAGGTAVPVPLDPDDNWRLTSEALAAAWTPATRILLINSPNNPTGRVLDDAELAAIATFAQERDLLVFSDEMYEKILYDGQRHTSIATLPGMAERTLVFNGLSKAYAMTGWRLGYVAGPRPYLQQIEKVHSHSVTCATSFVQKAGVVALTGPQEFIGEMVVRVGPAAPKPGRTVECGQWHQLSAGRGRVLRLRRHSWNRHDLDPGRRSLPPGGPRRRDPRASRLARRAKGTSGSRSRRATTSSKSPPIGLGRFSGSNQPEPTGSANR